MVLPFVRRTRFGELIFVQLIALLAMAAICGSLAMANGVAGPVTIRAVWEIDPTVDIDDFGGLWTGILPQEGAAQPDLAVTWTQDTSAFWPVWRLQVVAAPSSMPEGLGILGVREFAEWAGARGLTLASVQPRPGHRYETCLSYDPDLGGLSVAITDLTEERSVAAESFAVPRRTEAAVYPSAGIIGDKVGGSARVVSIEPGYIPIGVRWDVGVRDGPDELYIAAFNVTRSGDAAMNVALPHPVRGKFQAVLVSGQSQIELGEVSFPAGGNVQVPLRTHDWPLGPAAVRLLYEDEGQTTFSMQKEFVIGRLVATFQLPHIDRDEQVVKTTLRLSGPDKVPDVPVKVVAQWMERVWDSGPRRYSEQPTADAPVVFSGVVSVVDADSPAEVELEIPIPSEPGLWKLQLDPVIDSGVLVQADKAEAQVLTYAPANIAPGQPYTIAVYPDVQYFSRSYPETLTRMNHWVAENAEELGIGLLLQVGDITNDNNVEQWTRVRDNFTLLNGIVPYAFSLGNHDLATGSGVLTRGQSLVQQFFINEDFAGYRGSYPEGTLDNTYHEIRLGDQDYLILALECLPPDEVLAWSDQVISAHPKHRVILVTHSYVTTAGERSPAGRNRSYAPSTTVNEGDEIWHKLLRKHENVFMVFSGHVSSVAIPRHTSMGDKGNRVYEFLVDYQSEPNGGNGWFALVQLTPEGKVYVDAYSPYLEAYKIEKDRYGFGNRFTIDLDTGRISER